jgi:uncharacterized membrane protein
VEGKKQLHPQPNRKINEKGQAGQESGAPAPKVVLQNIRAVCELEQKALDERSLGERIGDGVSHYAGRAWFIVFHIMWFTTWITLNAGWVAAVPKFDPYPYPFLTFAVSLEAIFLSLFILMSQNREARQADQRAHLDLQINLLAELESTRMLEMLKALCQYHGLGAGLSPDIEQLSKPTEPKTLVSELQHRLPESN